MSRIIYYYQTFNGLKSIFYKDCPVTHIHLSAIHFGNNKDGSPYIHLNNDVPDDPKFDSVWKDIKTAKEQGIKIILMLGGAGGAYTDLFKHYDTYYPMLKKTIQDHSSITGIDLDIEESVDINNVKKLINDIIKDFGSDFCIAMAPVAYSLETNNSGMGGFSYKDLYNSPEGKYIQYFNGQFYNSYQPSDYETAIENGYPANKVVMGMISGQDMDNALSTLKTLKAKYPDMGGTFIWEYFNAPSQWEKSVADALKEQDSKYDILTSIYNIIKYVPIKVTQLFIGVEEYLFNAPKVTQPEIQKQS